MSGPGKQHMMGLSLLMDDNGTILLLGYTTIILISILVLVIGRFPKMGVPLLMDGLFHGNSYESMDDFFLG